MLERKLQAKLVERQPTLYVHDMAFRHELRAQ